MARQLMTSDLTETRKGEDKILLRTTVRAFVAAISALLITSLVVSRSGAALSVENASATIAIQSGTIVLTDDDRGESLFTITDMVPGRSTQRCIEVTYDGSIVPVDIRLTAEARGDLTPFLGLGLEVGSGGNFDSCDGFEPEGELFSGTLASLAVQTSEQPLVLGRLVNTGDSRTVRFTYQLADEQEAVDKRASASFLWESVPS
jgi:hypothetical protein